jgi:hypothetical protein
MPKPLPITGRSLRWVLSKGTTAGDRVTGQRGGCTGTTALLTRFAAGHRNDDAITLLQLVTHVGSAASADEPAVLNICWSI